MGMCRTVKETSKRIVINNKEVVAKMKEEDVTIFVDFVMNVVEHETKDEAENDLLLQHMAIEEQWMERMLNEEVEYEDEMGIQQLQKILVILQCECVS